MVSKKVIGFGLSGVVAVGAAAAFFTSSMPQENTAPNSPTQTATEAPAATSDAPQAEATATPQATSETPVYVFDDLTVNRPGGQTFTATAVASCGSLAQNFNLNNANQLAELEQACHARTEKSLNYYACDRENFFPSVPTDNPELRAHGLPEGRIVTQRHLWTAEQVSRASEHGMNSFTLQSVSDLDAALSTEGYTQIQNCGDVVYRGAQPKP